MYIISIDLIDYKDMSFVFNFQAIIRIILLLNISFAKD